MQIDIMNFSLLKNRLEFVLLYFYISNYGFGDCKCTHGGFKMKKIRVLSMLVLLFVFVSFSAQAAGFYVTSMNLDKSNLEMDVGDYFYLTPEYSPKKGEYESDSYSSSNTDIVKVNSRGRLTAVGEGSATITYTMKVNSTLTLTDTCTVTVEESDVSTVEMLFDTVTVRVDQTRLLAAYVRPYGAENSHIYWSSSNGNVVRVESNGEITGIAPGTAIITAQTSNGKSAVCKVTVPSRVVYGVESQVDITNNILVGVDAGDRLSSPTVRADVINAAKNNAQADITLRYTDKTTIDYASLRGAQFTAQLYAKNLKINFDTIENQKVASRMTVYPQNTPNTDGDFTTSIYTNIDHTNTAQNTANNYFGKNTKAIYLKHSGSLGMSVSLAIDSGFVQGKTASVYKLNGTDYALLADNLVADNNGYVYFNVESGGTYIIVEK